MRKFLAITLLASGLLSAPTRAQSVTPDAYDTQKSRFKAARYNSLAAVRALGKTANGRVIELRGQVKGSFARDGQRALLFQVAEGENIVIDAPDASKTWTGAQPGALSRFLCRVQSVPEADIALTLIAASDAPDPAQLFKPEDNDEGNNAVVAPVNGTLPSPEQIVLGMEEASLAPPIRIVAGGTPTTGKPILGRVTKPRTGNTLPARSLPRAAQSARATGRFFGFDDSQRVAYKNLARRNNPKLSDGMADNIANSILTAAQTHRLDPRFLAAIVTVESSFDPYCLSSSGAMGLGQLMPFNLRPLGVANAWDPGQNLLGSAKLLRQNLDIYARQPNGTLLAVAAYHAGVGAVNRAGKAVPQRASTQKYVWKVYYAYRSLAPELFTQ